MIFWLICVQECAVQVTFFLRSYVLEKNTCARDHSTFLLVKEVMNSPSKITFNLTSNKPTTALYSIEGHDSLSITTHSKIFCLGYVMTLLHLYSSTATGCTVPGPRHCYVKEGRLTIIRVINLSLPHNPLAAAKVLNLFPVLSTKLSCLELEAQAYAQQPRHITNVQPLKALGKVQYICG